MSERCMQNSSLSPTLIVLEAPLPSISRRQRGGLILEKFLVPPLFFCLRLTASLPPTELRWNKAETAREKTVDFNILERKSVR